METLDHLAQQFKVEPQQSAAASSASSSQSTATLTHLKHLRRSLRDIITLSATKQAELQSLITQSTTQQQQLSQQISAPSPALALQHQQQQCDKQKHETQQRVTVLMDRLNTLETSRQALETSESALASSKQSLQLARHTAMPTAVRTLQLYQQFSSIQWQYKLCSETRVAGRFVFEDEIVPFDYRIQPNDDDATTQSASAQQDAENADSATSMPRIMPSRAAIADQLWATMANKSQAKQQQQQQQQATQRAAS